MTVNHRDPGGTVQISYRNLEQLDEVMRRLAKGGTLSHKASPRHCERSEAIHHCDNAAKMDCFAALAMTARSCLCAHPRRFAFTAIDSSVRCAIADASEACLRMSSAAVPS